MRGRMLKHRPAAYDTWAEPRRLAWDNLDTCADGYYRSYLPPGEKAGSVEWSAKEVHNLERLVEEHPEKVASGKWGLLSIHQPGRTGAQCQEQYEKRGLSMGRSEADEGAATSSSKAAAPKPTPVTDRLPGDEPAPGLLVASMSSPVPPLHYSPAAAEPAANEQPTHAPRRSSKLANAGFTAYDAPDGPMAATAKRKADYIDGEPMPPPVSRIRKVVRTDSLDSSSSSHTERADAAGSSAGPVGVPPAAIARQRPAGKRKLLSRVNMLLRGAGRSMLPIRKRAPSHDGGARPARLEITIPTDDPAGGADTAGKRPRSASGGHALVPYDSNGIPLPPYTIATPGGTVPTPTLPAPYVACEGARQQLKCIAPPPSDQLQVSEALASQESALEVLRSSLADLRDEVEAELTRELGPNLGGEVGITYPTFTTMDDLSVAMNAAPRLAAAALAAHAMAPAVPAGEDSDADVDNAATAGAAAAADAAAALDGRLGLVCQRRVRERLALYGAVRSELETREQLQEESLQAMRRWEASGRPVGPAGSMPVFAQYAPPSVSESRLEPWP